MINLFLACVRCREVCLELGLVGVEEADLSALRYICECVSRRAGFMCAAGLTALLKKMDYKAGLQSFYWGGGESFGIRF